MFHYDLQYDCRRAINLLSVRYEELVILTNNFLHTSCKSASRKLHTRAILGILGGSGFSYGGRQKSHFFSLRVSMGAKKKNRVNYCFHGCMTREGENGAVSHSASANEMPMYLGLSEIIPTFECPLISCFFFSFFYPSCSIECATLGKSLLLLLFFCFFVFFGVCMRNVRKLSIKG